MFDILLNQKRVLHALNLIFGVLKTLLVLIFTLTRVHENEALLVFMYFQKKHRVESLSIVQDKYKSLEKRINKIFILLVVSLGTPSIIFVIIEILANVTSMIYLEITYLYWLGLTVFTIAIFNSSTFGLIYRIYRDHRMAFHGHVKPQLVLLITTELTLLSIGIIQVWVSLMNSCLSNKEILIGDLFNKNAICYHIFPKHFER